MAVQILDELSCIRVINNGHALIIHKNQVKTIDTPGDETVRLDIGEGPLHHVYIKLTEVTAPAGLETVQQLRDQIKAMLDTSSEAGNSGVEELLTAISTKSTQIYNQLLALRETVGAQANTLQTVADLLTDIRTFLDPAFVQPMTTAERIQFVGVGGQLQFPYHTDLAYEETKDKLKASKQLFVFNEGGLLQQGAGENEYLFDNAVGIISFGQMTEGQRITIISLK